MLQQQTDYPRSGNVGFLVSLSKPSTFSLRLRIPRWCKNPSVRVNGEDAGAEDYSHSCFAIARECGLHTIAFPAISCGVYRFPIYRAVAIAVEETLAELQSNEALEKVIFACFGNEVLEAYQQALK